GFGRQDVATELRLDLAVGVEDVEQNCLAALVADGAQVGADLRADPFELVAGGTVLLEHCLAAGWVPLELDRLAISGDHVWAAGRLGRGEELGGAGAEPGVGVRLQ